MYFTLIHHHLSILTSEVSLEGRCELTQMHNCSGCRELETGVLSPEWHKQ